MKSLNWVAIKGITHLVKKKRPIVLTRERRVFLPHALSQCNLKSIRQHKFKLTSYPDMSFHYTQRSPEPSSHLCTQLKFPNNAPVTATIDAKLHGTVNMDMGQEKP